MNSIKNYIESKGFLVKGRNIFKASKPHEKAGTLNQNNFWFFKHNVAPFKHGINYYSDKSIVDTYEHKQYFAKLKENERNDFNVNFEAYINSTIESSVFSKWIADKVHDNCNKNFENYYDIRGINKGYLESSVTFPFFDYDNNFVTAQIIKYDSNGKRVKSSFSTNWYHTYKPIKNSLGLNQQDKYIVAVNCFFGEHTLNGSDNIIGIVEAPKTAVILKEIYPNIDWLATAGEGNLFNKNLDVLIDRTVVLFPDAHTTQWKEFAQEKGFYCSDVLENEAVGSGDDLADHVFNINSDVFTDVHEHLYSLNIGEFDLEINQDSIKLDYQIKGKDTNYFIIIPIYYKGKKVLNQIDNSSEFKVDFKGKKFDMYNEDFELYTAQLDWHRPIIKNKEIVALSEEDFIFKLQHTFRIIKALNPINYKGIFKQAVERLRDSNFSFNERYVLNRLVPIWDNYNRDLSVFKTERKWKYKGGQNLTRLEFVEELNNHRFQQRTQIRLLAFYDVLSENRYIDIETDLAINRAVRGYSKLASLVNEWNEKVIGSKTLKTYFKKLDFIDKLSAVQKVTPLHISNTIYSGVEKCTKINYSQITELTAVKNKATIKSYLTFESDNKIRERILNDVFNLIEDLADIIPIRQRIGDKRIIDFETIARTVPNQDCYNDELLKDRGSKNYIKDIYKNTFPSMQDLEVIDTSNYSADKLKVHKQEYNYLLMLESIKTFSPLEKIETLNDENHRTDLIDNYLKIIDNKPIKELEIA